MKFLSSSDGTEEAGESRHGAHVPEILFTYEYAVLSPNTDSLILNFPANSFDGDRNEYDLTFTDGASGTFTRRIIRGGVIASRDTGIFGPDRAENEIGEHNGSGAEPGDDGGGGGSVGGSESGGGHHGAGDDGASHG